MTLINFGSNLNFVGRLTTIRLGFAERYHCWRQYRTTVGELRQYSVGELVELGISRYDIEEVAHEVRRPAGNSDNVARLT
jgi:uncharacterized protein YjiS (DUF1127 family)